ncbi:hypothetical protein [Cognatishimia activa]|uniref:Uncharacterized protein n=1 Tax=Cognatishimia activa TaxID=1715691 RepID=A0A0P1IVS8_9RHOB|nr:hypothetical protein [Cognatishimia activa]CUJ19112.1 hypothetical protein TA5113_02587 [Cognatishimia activa]CUK27621.1 hypothetical protein TA5114_03449 [Cognatishimia activa]
MHLKLFLFGLILFLIAQSILLAVMGVSVGRIFLAGIVTLVVAQLLQLVVVYFMVANETRKRRKNLDVEEDVSADTATDVQTANSQ